MINTYKRASIAHKTDGLLHPSDASYMAYMSVQAKLERIRQNARLSFRCKLAAMVASDNRKGKIWS